MAGGGGPRRLQRRVCRLAGAAACIVAAASLLLWAYTGRGPVAHLTGSGASLAQLHLLSLAAAGLAACLDGSPPALFVSHNAASQDWIVYLGQDPLYWCLDDEDCLARSRTPQGSSRELPGQLELHGLLSNSPLINPDFHNWSKAVLHACDGSGFLGHRAAPFYVAGRPLYSRGYHVIWRGIDWLRRRYHASMRPHRARLLFVGQGSSGIALMVAAPGIRAQFPYNRVKFALEGSVLPDTVPKLVERLKQAVDTHHVTANPDLKTCLAEQPDPPRSAWRCLLLSGQLTHMADTAFFFSGSNYDRWLAVHAFDIPCPIRDCRDDEQSFGRFERLRDSLLAALSPVDRKSEKDAIWMAGCWSRGHLVHDQLLTRVAIEGWSLAEALRRWYHTDGPLRLHLVDGSHPSNPTCPV